MNNIIPNNSTHKQFSFTVKRFFKGFFNYMKNKNITDLKITDVNHCSFSTLYSK